MEGVKFPTVKSFHQGRSDYEQNKDGFGKQESQQTKNLAVQSTKTKKLVY